MTTLSVYFNGQPGGIEEETVTRIIVEHGGTLIGMGSLLFATAAATRDVGAEVPAEKVDRCCDALREAGFTQVEVD